MAALVDKNGNETLFARFDPNVEYTLKTEKGIENRKGKFISIEDY